MDDESLYAVADPRELEVVAPFSTLFPIEEAKRTAIAESMRRQGFHPSKPIEVWRQRNVVLDGHTRRLCAIDAGSEVVIAFLDFESEEQALEYVIANQRDRRNLTDALLLKYVKALHQAKKGGPKPKGDGVSLETPSPNGRSAEHTAQVIGTSASKVSKAIAVEQNAAPEVKEAVANGTMTLNAAYRATPKRGTGTSRAEQAEKLERIADCLRENPDWSNVRVAEETGTHRGTVAKVRKEMGSAPAAPPRPSPDPMPARGDEAAEYEDNPELEPDPTPEPLPNQATFPQFDPDAAWASDEAAIRGLFRRWPEEDRYMFAIKLGTLAMLLKRECPDLESEELHIHLHAKEA